MEETDRYVHGYSEYESIRLADQAGTLAELLHHDTFYPTGASVLEVGCGIGAQTVILATNSPDAHITSVDRSQKSIDQAIRTAEKNRLGNVAFHVADIFNLPFQRESFDSLFVCFVLEHLEKPLRSLKKMIHMLKKGGTITVIEGDHGSFYCHPESADAIRTVKCLVDLQAMSGGDSLIGRRLYPLLMDTGFDDIAVSPRMVYVDSSKPEWVEGFSKKTFIAMVENVKDEAIDKGLIDDRRWNRGISGLYRATEHDGTFCYTFFKAVAIKK